MTYKERRIDIKDLPKSTAADVKPDDILKAPADTADVKGGAGVRTGKLDGIRVPRDPKRVTSSSGDPGI